MALNSGKIAEVLFESVCETYEHQTQLLDLVDFQPMTPADQQNTSGGSDGSNSAQDYGSGVIWQPVQQHSATQDGYDLTDKETGIVEETVPCLMGAPTSDYFKLRADSMNDTRFFERRGEQAGKKLGTALNQRIASAISTQGSLYYETAAANGFDAIGIAQAMLNERETLKDDDRFMVLSDRANLKYASDLAARGTLTNRPEDAYASGLIGANVAGFDVYNGAYTTSQGASAGTEAITSLIGTTPSGGESFIPEAGSVNAVTGVVTNVDYRIGKLGVASTLGFSVGDKVTISNINSVSLADKQDTKELMTFTIVDVDTDTSISVFPKPISASLVDTSASNQALWRAHANCIGDLTDTQTIDAINTDGGRSNIFGSKSAIQVNGGTLPANLLNEFGGMKVISNTMSNGQELYFAYDANLSALEFRCRVFFIAGVTVVNPAAAGSFVATAA